ncbi:MAG: YciI family protein [Gammaproteobacteria bacterium]
MQFALLIHDDESWHDLDDAQQGELLMAHKAFGDALTEAGVFVGGEPLEPSATAATVRSDGTVQDGPFVDSKEQLGGFYLIDVADQAAAIAWAKRLPMASATSGGIEVRGVPSYQ